MHLDRLPTLFVKDGEERKVYFTIQARELSEDGWIEKAPSSKLPIKTVANKTESVKPVSGKTETFEEIKSAAKAKSELIIDTK